MFHCLTSQNGLNDIYHIIIIGMPGTELSIIIQFVLNCPLCSVGVESKGDADLMVG